MTIDFDVLETRSVTTRAELNEALQDGGIDAIRLAGQGSSQNRVPAPARPVAVVQLAKLNRLLRLEPGDLQIFKGRYSLHRVKPLRGPTPRYVGIFSYAEIPDMVGHRRRTQKLYGKVLPIHYERAGLRADNLLD